MNLKNKAEGKYTILAMAFNRYSWVEKARNRLVGALGEYAKIKYAEMIEFPFDWAPEVQTLVKKVEELFDPNKVKLKSKFDLNKAFREAVLEASGEQQQIVDAKNSFLRDYIPKKETIKFLKLTRQHPLEADQLLIEMLTTFSPKLAKKLHL
jgi:hypothetical protein